MGPNERPYDHLDIQNRTALSEAIFKQVKKEEHHGNIYVLDRGLQSTRVMKDFDEKLVKFIIRSKENRKFEESEFFLDEEKSQKWDGWEVVKDSKVKLWGQSTKSKILYVKDKIY